MSQTTYTSQPGESYQGMLGDSKETDIISRALGGATNVEFGKMLAYGATPAKECAPLADGAAAITFAGVAVHRHTPDRASLTADEGIVPDEMVDLLRKGRVWVPVDEAVTPGEAVYVVHTGATKGSFRKSADGGNTLVIAGASWQSTTGAAGIALLDLNLP